MGYLITFMILGMCIPLRMDLEKWLEIKPLETKVYIEDNKSREW